MKFFLGFFLCLPFLAISQSPSLGQLLLPGGTHFAEGNKGKGWAFAATEWSLLAGGLAFDSHLKADNESEYYNYPLLVAQQVYVVDKMDYYLKQFHQIAQQNDMPYRYASLKDMLLAPLDYKQFKEPLVWGMVGFGVAMSALSWYTGNYHIQDIESIWGYGQQLPLAGGHAAYSATGTTISYGAGLSEEMLFRGLLQPALSMKRGSAFGLHASSLLFSAAHLPSYLTIKNPWELALAVGQITAFGYFFGINARNNEYDIRTAIAAHTWYDIAVILGSWIAAPDMNPLGFRVSFRL